MNLPKVLLMLVAFLGSASTVRAQRLTEEEGLRGLEGYVTQICLSADGKRLAVAGREAGRPGLENEFAIWDLTSRRRIASTSAPGMTTCLAFSPDGKRLAAAGYQGVSLWDLVDESKGSRLVRVATPKSPALAANLQFSPEGKRLAIIGTDAVVWDVDTAKEVSTFSIPARIHASAMDPAMSKVAVSRFQDVDLYELTSGKAGAALLDHRGAVLRVAYSGDGKVLAVVSCLSDADNRFFTLIKLWDADTAQERRAFKPFEGYPRDVALSHHGDRLMIRFSVGLDGPTLIRVLDVARARWTDLIRFPGRSSAPSCIAFDRAGTTLAGGFVDGTVKIWRITD